MVYESHHNTLSGNHEGGSYGPEDVQSSGAGGAVMSNLSDNHQLIMGSNKSNEFVAQDKRARQEPLTPELGLHKELCK